MAGEAAGEAAAKPSAGAHTFETDRIAIEIHQEARRLLSVRGPLLRLPPPAAAARSPPCRFACRRRLLDPPCT